MNRFALSVISFALLVVASAACAGGAAPTSTAPTTAIKPTAPPTQPGLAPTAVAAPVAPARTPAQPAASQILAPIAKEVAVGDQFSVTLDSNATTGFRWQLAAPLDESVVKLAASQYLAPTPSGGAPLVGAGGREIWTFQAIGAGKTTFSLQYTRPWETDVAPARVQNVEVAVR